MPLHTHRHTNRPLNYIMCDYGVYNIGPVGIISVSKACHFLSCFFLHVFSFTSCMGIKPWDTHVFVILIEDFMLYIYFPMYLFPLSIYHGDYRCITLLLTTHYFWPGRSRETSDRGLGESQQPGGPWRLFEV